MGESARERFRRIQAESATGTGKESGGLGGQAPVTVHPADEYSGRRGAGDVPESGRVSASDLYAALLLKRKERLAERMTALGVPVVLAEMPDDSDELADLERLCADEERATK